MGQQRPAVRIVCLVVMAGALERVGREEERLILEARLRDGTPRRRHLALVVAEAPADDGEVRPGASVAGVELGGANERAPGPLVVADGGERYRKGVRPDGVPYVDCHGPLEPARGGGPITIVGRVGSRPVGD